MHVENNPKTRNFIMKVIAGDFNTDIVDTDVSSHCMTFLISFQHNIVKSWFFCRSISTFFQCDCFSEKIYSLTLNDVLSFLSKVRSHGTYI